MDVSNLDVNVVLGIIVPIAVGVISKCSYSSAVKSYLSVALSIAVGIVLAITSGKVDLNAIGSDPATAARTIVAYCLIVAVLAQTAYDQWVKPSGLADYLQENVGNKD